MTAREDLDLRELLGGQYEWYMRAVAGDVGPRPPVAPAPGPDDATLSGAGPAECSSWTALALLPEVTWDVNGWYRLLGVPHDATRRQLCQAYMAADPGQRSRRLAYVLKQLLQRDVRRRYDLCPPGTLFTEDEQVRDDLVRRAHEASARFRAQGISVTPEEILGRMGFDRVAEEDPAVPPEVPQAAPWGYAWYRKGAADGRRLQAWQEALVRALAGRRIRTRIAVGSHAGPGRWSAECHDGRLVFFLAAGVLPDEEDAALAAAVAVAEGLVVVTGRW